MMSEEINYRIGRGRGIGGLAIDEYAEHNRQLEVSPEYKNVIDDVMPGACFD